MLSICLDFIIVRLLFLGRTENSSLRFRIVTKVCFQYFFWGGGQSLNILSKLNQALSILVSVKVENPVNLRDVCYFFSQVLLCFS